MASDAGKGGRYRSVDRKKYNRNFENIDWGYKMRECKECGKLHAEWIGESEPDDPCICDTEKKLKEAYDRGYGEGLLAGGKKAAIIIGRTIGKH